MSYSQMSRRALTRFAVLGVVFTVIGLLLRPVNIDFAVGAFLLAVGLLGMAGYGLLERVVIRQKR
jgi:hypothetical protein